MSSGCAAEYPEKGVAHCTCPHDKSQKQPCNSDQPIVSLLHDILSGISFIRTPGYAKRDNHRALLTILDNVMAYRTTMDGWETLYYSAARY
jgi:hypothetical protein